MQKAREEKDGDRYRDKHAKLGQGRINVATGNIPMDEPFPTNTQNLAVNGEHHHDGKLHSLMHPIFSDKKVAGTDIRSEYSSYPGITNRDDSISNTGQNDTEKQMNGVLHSGNLGRIVKDTSENNAPGQYAPQSKRLASETSNASSPKVPHRNKKGRHELPDLNLPHYPVQAEKVISSGTHQKSQYKRIYQTFCFCNCWVISLKKLWCDLSAEYWSLAG
jgi:hypothetical protein